MKYNRLGKTDVEISEIGFGCMSLVANNSGNQAIIDRAIELGINYFDTADLYDKGENEMALGRMLKSRRKDLIIATKVGNQWRPDGSGWDWNPRKEYIIEAVEASLQRLQTDYIDLYQLHGGTMEDNIPETIEAFELLAQQGKIRHYGISSIRPAVISTYLRLSNIASVMMQYSLLDRQPEESVMEQLEEHKIALLARGSLAKGLLAGNPAAPYLDHSAKAVGQASEAVATVAGDRMSAAQAAIQFVLRKPAIASAVVGIRTLAQCEDAGMTGSRPALSQDELIKLEAWQAISL